MKIVLLTVGKIDETSFSQLIETYVKRLSHYIPFQVEVIPDIKNTRNLSKKNQKNQEGATILKFVQPNDSIILLDEKGKLLTSLEFARYIEKKNLTIPKRLIFIAGGPYGFSDEVYKRADEKLSLSRMTFTHQMIRLFFVEQLYRAMTILQNEPYHHE